MSFRIPNASCTYDFPVQYINTYGITSSTVIEGVSATCYRISGTGQNRYLLMQIDSGFEIDLEQLQTSLPMESVTITKNWETNVNPLGRLNAPFYENAYNDFYHSFVNSPLTTYYPSITEIRNFQIPSKTVGQTATLDLVIEPVESSTLKSSTISFGDINDKFNAYYNEGFSRIFFETQGDFSIGYNTKAKSACEGLNGRFTVMYNTLETRSLPTMDLSGDLVELYSEYPCTRTFKFGSQE